MAKQSVSESLRRAIVDSKIPYLTLEQETGLSRASIMRFVRGDLNLRMDSADKLAKYFGLQLTKSKEK
jgi:plasmid maintenance system antidote protein VapI